MLPGGCQSHIRSLDPQHFFLLLADRLGLCSCCAQSCGDLLMHLHPVYLFICAHYCMHLTRTMQHDLLFRDISFTVIYD
jgi:hypothetical protein